MPVRIVEGQLPYTGGTGIEIDSNKVISLLLREENNLIMVNNDNEVYTDLQLQSGLTPNSDFPVGVTVGKVLQSDGWTKSGLILNWKTTSGDYARWIYANDGKIYFDNGTGTWKQVYYSSEVNDLIQTLRNYVDANYQPKLIAGTGITIDQNNVISASVSGMGDVVGPEGAIDGNLAVFDGTTGKLIKDGGPIPTTTVIDNLNSTSTTSALSANQGRILDGKIADMMGLGKFLSLWNSTTGQPISFPLATPYSYTTGDYFIIEVVSSATPPVNYKPNGSSYTGTASSTPETEEVEIGDVYVYDGQTWLLQSNHGKTVTFANIAGLPSDNTALNNTLNAKQDVLTAGQNIDISNNKISTNWIEVNVATAYGTAAKVGTTTAGNYTPTKGDFLLVNFVNGCSVDNPTLNVDGSGAKNIRTGSANAAKGTFALGTTANSNIKALLYYDGKYYRCWSTTNSNTIYSAMSVDEGQTGTATSARTMRADYLKSIIKYHAVNNSRLSDDWYNGTAIAPSQASIYYEFAKRDIQAGTDLEIVGISSHNLPEGYTELSFLGGSGSGYINTGNIIQCKDTVKIKFKRPTATTPSSTQSFFGSIQGSSSVPRYNIGFRTNGYAFGGVNNTVDYAPIDTNIHTVEQGYDGVDYYYKYDNGAKTTYTPTSTTDPSINAYLFARNGSTVIYSGGVRIYYVEWYREDGTEVAHLIPAQRDDDGILGMYDLVSDTFLAPAGSGTWSGEPLGNVINFTNDSGFLTSSTGVTSVNGSHGAVTVQPTLVSGTNIKTVNSTSLLGSGNIAVQPTLVSGTNIKTVNNESLLGSGNITIQGGGVISVNGQTGAVTVNDVKVGNTAPASPTEGMVWYDTDLYNLQVYNGSTHQWDTLNNIFHMVTPGVGDDMADYINILEDSGSRLLIFSFNENMSDLWIVTDYGRENWDEETQKYENFKITAIGNVSDNADTTFIQDWGLTRPKGIATLEIIGTHQLDTYVCSTIQFKESGGLKVAPNSPITGIKYVWYGTEADYNNLNQYYTDTPGDTEFHTF